MRGRYPSRTHGLFQGRPGCLKEHLGGLFNRVNEI